MIDPLEEFISKGHSPSLDENGDPDEFALDVDPDESSFVGHNGYKCVRCDEYICIHCVRCGWEKINDCSGKTKRLHHT